MYIGCEKYLFNFYNGIFNRLFNLKYYYFGKKIREVFYIDMVSNCFVGIW
jgi:hypothetical protein